ncbi:MAG: zeta toxin family protein [Candidatus Paceibacteria bacterium]
MRVTFDKKTPVLVQAADEPRMVEEERELGPQGEELREFDPEQPRDKNGSFTMGTVASFTNEKDGVSAHVTSYNGRLHVTRADDDSKNVIGSSIFSGEGMKDKAIEKAQKLAGVSKRFSEDQPRDPDGKFASGGGTSTSQKDIAARPDFSGSMKVPGGTLTLSQNRTTKVAEVQAFAKSEMSKLPAGTQAALNSGMKTSDMYKTGDKYNADRVSSFHNPVVDKALAGKTPQGSPKVVFVGGGPAAGKTTASDDAARNMSDHVAINVDDIRTAAPEFTALLPDRLMPINEETGDIRDRLISEAGDARYNMIIDGVGSKSAAENVANLVGKGYTASYVYVHREVGDARQRAEDRPYMTSKIADMRILPQGMVEGFHDKARGAFSSMAKVSSEVKVIDKSRPEFGKEGKVVFWKDGSNIKVYDAEGVKRVENGGKTKIRIYP